MSSVVLELPAELPITARATEIAAAIRDHQVVVVAGETGSGKTTQLPKICLQLGRTSIGHTQPRRIAARSVATRLAEETHTELGDLIGYQVRFTRKASAQTRVKLMTDGVLLAEIGHDRELRRYDTIIIDEAHERSLNIDFLLGYLKQLLPRRPDLKVIITSATIDTARFAAHFGTPDRPAPVVEVTGRSYPVEMRYRPLTDPEAASGSATTSTEEDEGDQTDGICRAVRELIGETDGDILVFLSGEREIRDAAEAVEGMRLNRTEVLPLYARLSAAEQHRVFSSHPGRRIVLATNVAETSLTVPGIRAVIDTGKARISRYSARTKVQRLPIEAISQASANQRAGRCGRLGPGICIRLYAEEDFLGRPAFTEPEILRTNLASVILQMTAAGLGDIASFPFVEAPDRAQITDGLRLLDELGALKDGSAAGAARPRLTGLGRQLAGIPLDPRMARMLLAGERQGCLREMLIIVSGLSVQDPRERPPDHQQAADEQHRRFWAAARAEPVESSDGGTRAEHVETQQNASEGSDFLALLRLWDYLRDQQKALSGNAFRRMCKAEYLHFLRIREWQDLHTQLRQIARDLKLNRNDEPAPAGRIHTAVLTGLLSQVGLAEVSDSERRGTQQQSRARRGRPGLREYLGARGTKFAINPGSSVAKIAPPLVMAAEIVETSRLWARTVAGIDARQVEEVGAHLLKHTYSEPHWSARSAAVMAYETVSLYGIPIVGRRRTSYARIDPVVSRELFIRSALVEGDWRTRHHFFADNQRLRAETEGLEDRVRRRDVVVDDQVIFDFYDARIPTEITSGAAFDAWWKTERHRRPELLDLRVEDLIAADGSAVHADDFPDHWQVGDLELPVSYRFEPGADRDGVSVRIPLAVLNRLDQQTFSAQVPGLRADLATELIRSLPKSRRTSFVPAPEFARRALAWLAEHPDTPIRSFPEALGVALRALTGHDVPPTDWRPDEVPTHLRPTFVITDSDPGDPGQGGSVVGEGKDLAALQRRLLRRATGSLNEAAAGYVRSGATDWVFGDLPRSVTVTRGGQRVVAYPHLRDEGSSVGSAVAGTSTEADRQHVRGLRRLVTLGTPDPTRWVVSHLTNPDKLALGASPYPGVPALLADARLASVGELIARSEPGVDWPGAGVRDAGAFRSLCDRVRADNADLTARIVRLAAEALRSWQQLRSQLPAVERSAPAATDDMSEQIANLVFDGFLAATAYDHLIDLPRYLRAAELRVQTLRIAPGRDTAGLGVITECEDAYAALCARQPPGPLPPQVEEISWMLEELRVSLFAQSLRTRHPVSAKRIRTAISAAESSLQAAR